jgi:hypothetical protein
MTPYHWILAACFGVFIVAALRLAIQVIAGGAGTDPSHAKGSALRGVLYSFTGAMSPFHKESAKRHIPTYIAGLLFHGGVFFGMLCATLLFFNVALPPGITLAAPVILTITAACGLGLLVKRIVTPKMRHFTVPDDYFSNILVVGFQALTAAALLYERFIPGLFIYTSILFLYIPLGKLRHAIYFPFTRTFLGMYFGKRGVWGNKRQKEWETPER